MPTLNSLYNDATAAIGAAEAKAVMVSTTGCSQISEVKESDYDALKAAFRTAINNGGAQGSNRSIKPGGRQPRNRMDGRAADSIRNDSDRQPGVIERLASSGSKKFDDGNGGLDQSKIMANWNKPAKKSLADLEGDDD